jgi:hypothetical protein
VTLTPDNEYEAARTGAAAIQAFAKAGGRFTDKPNLDGLTSAMIAASRGSEAIQAFHEAGGRFTDWQNPKGYTAAMVAVIAGPNAIRAFARAGGKFTDQQDHHGMTSAMWAASRQDVGWPSSRMELKFAERFLVGGLINPGGDAIQAFVASGGRFTDQQNNNVGQTVAMLAIFNSPEAVRVFAKAGGHFTGQKDKSGKTAEVYAVFRGAATIAAFAEAGGIFTDNPDPNSSSEFNVALGTPEMITAYSKAGGLFRDRKFGRWTSQMLASNKVEWEFQTYAALRGRPLTDDLKAPLRERFGARDIAAAQAYKEAVARQGGLRHVR